MTSTFNEQAGALPELTPELLAEFHQFLAFRQVQQQQAITSVLKTTAPAPQTVTPTSSGLPAIPILKLLQATHFDNGVQKGTVRHKLTFEAWTSPMDQINVRRPEHKVTAALYEYWTFLDKLKPLCENGSITQQHHDEFAERLHTFKDVATDDLSRLVMAGLLYTKTGGTHYFDRQWCFAVLNRKTLQVEFGFLFIDNEPIPLTVFVSSDCKSNPLKGKAQSQSRVDFCGFSKAGWATSEQSE
jgi:hypothetical protein